MPIKSHLVKGEWIFLKPRPDLCQTCAVKHPESAPHNKDSLYYQMSFQVQHGREPTWKDAMAHCSEEVKVMWIEQLTKLGVKIE